MQTPRLQFSPDRRYLAVADADGISLIATPLAGAPEIAHRFVVPEVRAVALFADQLWALDRDGTEVHRWSLDGRPVAPPVAVSMAPCTGWRVAPVGPPAVLAEGATRAALIDDLGTIVEHPVDGGGLAIPISGRRHVLCDGQEVRLRRGLPCRLAAGVRPIAGAALFDGAFVALVVEAGAAGRRSALILSTTTARLQRRVPVPAGELRLAQRRGLVIARPDPRSLVAIDLRLGRVVGRFEAEADLDDFAIDDDGQIVAVRRGLELQLHEIRDWLAGTAHAPSGLELGAEPPPGGAADGAAPTGPDDELAAAAPAPHRRAPAELEVPTLPRPPLLAFGRRADAEPVPRADARRRLADELRTVGLRALVAVARGWDTRRIGYPADSAHPYEMEVAAILGMNQGHAPEHLAAARDRLAAHERALAARPDHRGPATPVGELAAEARPVAARRPDPAPGRGPVAARRDRAPLRRPRRRPRPARSSTASWSSTMLEPAGAELRTGSRASCRPRRRWSASAWSRSPPARVRSLFAGLPVREAALDRLRGQPIDLGPRRATSVRTADRDLEALHVPAEVKRELVLALAVPVPASLTDPLRLVRCAAGAAAAATP